MSRSTEKRDIRLKACWITINAHLSCVTLEVVGNDYGEEESVAAAGENAVGKGKTEKRVERERRKWTRE